MTTFSALILQNITSCHRAVGKVTERRDGSVQRERERAGREGAEEAGGFARRLQQRRKQNMCE